MEGNIFTLSSDLKRHIYSLLLRSFKKYDALVLLLIKTIRRNNWKKNIFQTLTRATAVPFSEFLRSDKGDDANNQWETETKVFNFTNVSHQSQLR